MAFPRISDVRGRFGLFSEINNYCRDKSVSINIPGDKNVVCITGTVWTGSNSAPRHMLMKEGFLRPTWFTTGRAFNDADYRHISTAQFHLAMTDENVLAHIEYGGNFIGIMTEDFESAVTSAERGALVVGPPEIAAQLAAKIPQAVLFAFKDVQMDLSKHLEAATRANQLHRIDVDVLEPGVWLEVYRLMIDIIGLAERGDPT